MTALIDELVSVRKRLAEITEKIEVGEMTVSQVGQRIAYIEEHGDKEESELNRASHKLRRECRNLAALRREKAEAQADLDGVHMKLRGGSA